MVVNGQLGRGGERSADVFSMIGQDIVSEDYVALSDEVDIAEGNIESLNISPHLNQALTVLKKVQVLIGLPEAKLRELAGVLRLMDFEDGHAIFE